ncbi:MAG TPA: T9SS type A sorting domain-containing protein [Bacteroidia bacterium]|nr:T9SS type A sorting domain-containing protein [Bacteroidia bacterium]
MQLQHLLKTTTALSILAFSLVAQGQPFYNFSKTTEPYTEISGGQLITNTFTQNSYQVNLGIPVKMFDEQAGTSLNVGVNGFIVASGPQYAFATDPFTAALKKIDNTSSISATAETTGTDTVFIIQWKNLEPDSGTPGDYINMQCKLYLRSQTIEFHYGPSSIANDKLNDSAQDILAGIFLLSTDFTLVYENQRISGPCNSPSIQFSPAVQAPLLGFPPNGTVYRFTRKSGVGIGEDAKLVFSVYPNPATDRIYIQLPSGEIENVKITTVTGQTLYNGNYTSGGIDISALVPGVYTVTITNSNGEVNTTLLKK